MLSGENKAGILVTVIVHLTVIIFLLAASIHTIAHRGNEMILLDFDDYEELVAKEKEPELQEEEISPEEMAAIQASIEQMLAERNLQHAEYHNITTSRNVDARNTDADQLYEDAAKLAEALRSGQSVSYDDEGDLAPSRPDGGKEQKDDKGGAPAYSGASVLSWSLSGRQARHLEPPAYKCYNGGTVTVIIKVNRAGRVVDATVDPSTSSNDPCLRKWAVSFAKTARFSESMTAANPQTGDIIYQFIAQ